MNRSEVVLVDINDNELKIESKVLAHAKPMLHRAFSIYLYNDKKELLIQKRASNKYHSPNLWANACCSHPRMKENIKESAIDRLKDEVGISCDIDEIFSFIYMTKFNEDLYEYEFDHVFIGKYNGEIILNEEEASDYKWINLNDLEFDLLNNPNKYASWFIISAPRVIEYLKK